MLVHLTLKSSNKKTGAIPVSTTERDSCPDDCAMRAECYADTGPLALHWDAVSDGRRAMSWEAFCDAVETLEDGQLWRHNQAGDLPRKGSTIDPVKLGQLVKANQGRRGFTYSHHRDAASLEWIRHANAWGFTVNLSANDLRDADRLADTGAGPVVVVLPSHQLTATETPAGRPVTICPHANNEHISCALCQLCQKADRRAIVGFPAHGTKRRIINLRLEKATA